MPLWKSGFYVEFCVPFWSSLSECFSTGKGSEGDSSSDQRFGSDRKGTQFWIAWRWWSRSGSLSPPLEEWRVIQWSYWELGAKKGRLLFMQKVHWSVKLLGKGCFGNEKFNWLKSGSALTRVVINKQIATDSGNPLCPTWSEVRKNQGESLY